MKQSEHHEQVALFDWAAYQSNRYPELKMMFAVPNGGQRNIRVAMKLKKEGVKAGVPDIFLPIVRDGWHGLFIEMKVGKNKCSLSQINWIAHLRSENYRVTVCYGFDEARRMIENYLGIKESSTRPGPYSNKRQNVS